MYDDFLSYIIPAYGEGKKPIKLGSGNQDTIKISLHVFLLFLFIFTKLFRYRMSLIRNQR